MDRIEDFEVNSPRWLSLEDFEGEVWKDIPGYEERYQASNMGRIKSKEHDKQWIDKKGYLYCHHYKSKILCSQNNGHGYYWVMLNEHRKYIHRLVGKTFIPNHLQKEQIDHINTIKNDNRVINLRWATRRENIDNILSRYNRYVAHSDPIIALNYFGEYVCEYQSAQAAAYALGIPPSVVKDTYKDNRPVVLAKGYRFIRKRIYNKNKDYSVLYKKSKNSSDNLPTMRTVVLLNNKGIIVELYKNIIIASKCHNCSFSLVSKRCRKQIYADGYSWSYLKDLDSDKQAEAISLFLKKYA